MAESKKQSTTDENSQKGTETAMSSSAADDEVIPTLNDTQDTSSSPDDEPRLFDQAPDSEEDNSHRNPFLPYENLEKLAHEREVFQQEFEKFMKDQRLQPPASSALPDMKNLDRLVHLMTERILAEYIPQIEQRVRAEVIRQLNKNNYKI